MSLYDRILANIEEKKSIKESGNFNEIPFPFKRYHEYFSGFSPGDYIGLLGSTGSGKSRLLRFWMYSMIDFIMRTSYKCKIIYFSLEDPEIPVGTKILSHYLYTRHNISIGPRTLESKEEPLAQKYLDVIKADELFWRKFYNIVEIVNGLSSPNQIQAKVREVYKNNKDSHIIVLIDNQSNITCDEQDANDWAAITRLSREIIRLGFCKAGITTLTILQLDFDTVKNTFRNVGKGSLINIEPNLSSIGDAKVVARSMHYVWALFDPWQVEIERYPNAQGYNISILRNRFKALLHLKSNEGTLAPRFGMSFDGLHEIYSELPMTDNKEALENIYAKILFEERMRVEKLKENKISFGY